jgi:hypothetical protein
MFLLISVALDDWLLVITRLIAPIDNDSP